MKYRLVDNFYDNCRVNQFSIQPLLLFLIYILKNFLFKIKIKSKFLQ